MVCLGSIPDGRTRQVIQLCKARGGTPWHACLPLLVRFCRAVRCVPPMLAGGRALDGADVAPAPVSTAVPAMGLRSASKTRHSCAMASAFCAAEETGCFYSTRKILAPDLELSEGRICSRFEERKCSLCAVSRRTTALCDCKLQGLLRNSWKGIDAGKVPLQRRSIVWEQILGRCRDSGRAVPAARTHGTVTAVQQAVSLRKWRRGNGRPWSSSGERPNCLKPCRR